MLRGNVVGNHGATIGELDEDTMFYFASRGIDKEHAEILWQEQTLTA